MVLLNRQQINRINEIAGRDIFEAAGIPTQDEVRTIELNLTAEISRAARSIMKNQATDKDNAISASATLIGSTADGTKKTCLSCKFVEYNRIRWLSNMEIEHLFECNAPNSAYLRTIHERKSGNCGINGRLWQQR